MYICVCLDGEIKKNEGLELKVFTVGAICTGSRSSSFFFFFVGRGLPQASSGAVVFIRRTYGFVIFVLAYIGIRMPMVLLG